MQKIKAMLSHKYWSSTKYQLKLTRGWPIPHVDESLMFGICVTDVMQLQVKSWWIVDLLLMLIYHWWYVDAKFAATTVTSSELMRGWPFLHVDESLMFGICVTEVMQLQVKSWLKVDLLLIIIYHLWYVDAKFDATTFTS